MSQKVGDFRGLEINPKSPDADLRSTYIIGGNISSAVQMTSNDTCFVLTDEHVDVMPRIIIGCISVT